MRFGQKSGFTLIELIIALAFFSFMMVIISVGVIQVMRMYESNLATRRTQQAARIVVEDITREIRSATQVSAAVPNRLCLEGAQTVEYLRQDANQGADGVLLKRILQGGCANSTATISTQELAGSATLGASDVQVRQFNPTSIQDGQGATTSVKFIIGISTGPRDLLDSSGTVCQPGPGAQFCSATSYSSIVSMRGGEQ